MNMEPRRTYKGYDSKNNYLAHCEAKDAKEYIDPDRVKAALENFNSVVKESMDAIITAINTIIAPDAQEAVIVEGTRITPILEEVNEGIAAIANQMIESVSTLYDEAVIRFNEIQTQANNDAYQQVRTYTGVVNVIE